MVLETKIKGIISGNGATLIQREFFGANKFQKAPVTCKKTKMLSCIHSFIKNLYRKLLLVVILIGKIT